MRTEGVALLEPLLAIELVLVTIDFTLVHFIPLKYYSPPEQKKTINLINLFSRKGLINLMDF